MSPEWIRRQLATTRGLRSTKPPYAQYADDPIGFFKNVLGFIPWEAPGELHGQADILRAIVRRTSVAVRSGHKTGKTSGAAGLAWWWWATRPLARVVMMAPAAHQVRKALWRELRLIHRNARLPLRAEVPILPSTGVLSDDGREIVGVAADSAEGFSGVSGPHVLYLIDEASGVDEGLMEAVEGNMAGGARRMLFSQPLRPSGTFREAFYSAREHYERIHLNCEVAAKYAEGIPGIATQEWVDSMLAKHGEDSFWYQVRVRGNFADEAENTVIGLALVDAAAQRWEDTADEGELVLGVDVAREGDDESIIAPRRGKRIGKLVKCEGKDGPDVANEVLRVVRNLRRPDEHDPIRVNVDAIGVGASVYDHLRQSDRVRVCGVNSAATADDDEHFVNLRAQLHFDFRDWLKEGGAIPPDDEALQAELIAPTHKAGSRGRYQVEKKDEIKKRLKRSPDRADAVMLSTYSGGSVGSTKVYRAGSSRSSR